MRAQEAIEIAHAQVGYVEGHGNITKFGAWYKMNGQPWCAIFISWVFRDHLALIGGKHAYTPTFAKWFKDAGQWGSTPKPGAIAFFDFPDSVDRIQHVEIVVSVDGGAVCTIGGNTSSGNSGSQSNGGGVYERTRSKAVIVGYGYPKYEPDEQLDFKCTKTHGAHGQPTWFSRTHGKWLKGHTYRMTTRRGAWLKLRNEDGAQWWGCAKYFK